MDIFESELSFLDFCKKYLELEKSGHSFFGAKGDFSGLKRGKPSGKEEVEEQEVKETEKRKFIETEDPEKRRLFEIFTLKKLKDEPRSFLDFYAFTSIETLMNLAMNMIWLSNDRDQISEYFRLPFSEAKQKMLTEVKMIHDNLPGMKDFLKDRENEVFVLHKNMLDGLSVSLEGSSYSFNEFLDDTDCVQVIFKESFSDYRKRSPVFVSLEPTPENLQYIQLSEIASSSDLDDPRIVGNYGRLKTSYSKFKGTFRTYLLKYFVAPFLRIMHTECTLDLKLNRAPHTFEKDFPYKLNKVFRVTERSVDPNFHEIFETRQDREIYKREDTSRFFRPLREVVTIGKGEAEDKDMFFIQSTRMMKSVDKFSILSIMDSVHKGLLIVPRSIKKVGSKNMINQKWEWLESIKSNFSRELLDGVGAKFNATISWSNKFILDLLISDKTSYNFLFEPIIHPDSLKIASYVNDLENSKYLVNEDIFMSNSYIMKPFITIFETLFEILVWKAQARGIHNDVDIKKRNPSLDSETAVVFVNMVLSLKRLSKEIPDNIVLMKRFVTDYVLPPHFTKFMPSGSVAQSRIEQFRSRKSKSEKNRIDDLIELVVGLFESRKKSEQSDLFLLLFHLSLSTFYAFELLPLEEKKIAYPHLFKTLQILDVDAWVDETVRDLEMDFLKMIFVYSFLKKSPFTVYPAINRILLAHYITRK